jgi:hypothetical protein
LFLFNRWKELAKKGKIEKIPLKEDDDDAGDVIADKIKQATQRKENAKTNEDKLAAAEALEESKALLKAVRKLMSMTIESSDVNQFSF